MTRRLDRQPGEWIDRDWPIEFEFEGRAYAGFAGDVLSSALWANDVRLLGRSFKYHRPRGVYTMAGHDANVMVQDAGRTNLRGDTLAIEAGLSVRAVNTFGSLKRDRLAVTEKFGRFLPVGFYYKAFHTPRRLFPFFERQMRKVAGLGEIRRSNRPIDTPKDYAFCDVVVVGTGPAGMSAALEAADRGLDVMLVDEAAEPGGSLNWQWAGDAAAQRQRSAMVERIASHPQIELRTKTQAAGWYTDHWIALVDHTKLTKLRARAMIAATGCFEQPAVFGHNDLPGVMLGSAAQRLMHLYAVRPFDRCVVLAANRDAYRLAMQLDGAGVKVASVVDLRREGEASPLGEAVKAAGINVRNGCTVYEATPGRGKQRIAAAMVCAIDEAGEPRTSSMSRTECDGIAVSVGWAAASGLISEAGGRMGYAGQVQQFVPRQLPAGVYAAGRVNGVYELDDQFADGRRAALEAAAHLGRYDGPIEPVPEHRGPRPSHPYPYFAHDKKKNFVDLDEDLHLADFINAHQEGYDSVELAKRYTTVGMGPSQGKLSNVAAARILAKLNGESLEKTGTTTARPFHHPVTLAHLAGRRFAPIQRTPLHEWHAAHGGVFMHAGTWLRPEYYEAGRRDRDECILNEAFGVRQNVAMIDVSTLGKLQIAGPDAAAFLERIYTGRFARQAVGRLRYCLACDESGVIIEDGIVARLADDVFYVTATSSGAGAFYREMQRWAIIWQMDVVLSNLTGQMAAMNIAGPNSRSVLASLTDVDLSAAAFEYLQVRRGTVVGVDATLLRVGFVGELGYEIHVPASQAHHVWLSLFEAGQSQGIGPFGVEAQRLLRLEKGHLIVSQDTDALTFPTEADVNWAVAKGKQFFVGRRSHDILNQKPLTRQLVAFRFAESYYGPLPSECHLIIEDGEIAGRVTSIAPQSTLGYPLGLAFVLPDLAEPGTAIQIRVDGGAMVEASVATIPLYDPDNERQSV